jgi:hypothetical protein
MPCSPTKVNRRFGGACRLHLQGGRVSHARNRHEAAANRLHGITTQKIKLFIVTCCDSLKSNFVYHVETILGPHTEKEYDKNMYTFCAFFSDKDILLYYKRRGLGAESINGCCFL